MNLFHKTCWLLIFFFSVIAGKAQNRFSGFVTDSDNGRPVTFAKISVNDGKVQTFTGFNGEFAINSVLPIYRVEIILVGYQPLVLNSGVLNNVSGIKIPVTPLATIKEYSTSGEAKKVMRAVLKNKDQNDFFKQKNSWYTSYNKLVVTTGENQLKKKWLLKIAEKLLDHKFLKRTENNTLFLSESVTERKRKNSVFDNEKITATKACGIKDPSLLSLNTQWQFVSFYKPLLLVEGFHFISPISKSGLKRYEYSMYDSVKTDTATYYLIYYLPKKNKYFDGFSGIMLIDKNTSALVGITAKPDFNRHVDFEIRQLYEQNNKQWVPAQLELNSGLLDIGNRRKNYHIRSQTFFSDIKTDTLLRKKTFNTNLIEIADSALVKNEEFWNKKRSKPLSAEEDSTYQFYKNFKQLNTLEKYIIFLQSVQDGKLPIGIVTIDNRNLINYNLREGYRFMLSLQTNYKLSNIVSTGAYIAHGSRDGKWKYGGNMYVTPYTFRFLKIGVSAAHDITEAGSTSFLFSKKQYSSEPIRTLSVSLFDKQNTGLVYAESRFLKYSYFHIGLSHYSREPLYTYTFGPDSISSFRFSEVRFGFRYNYGEQFIKTLRNRVSIGSAFPSFWLQITRGLPVLQSSFSYTKIDAKSEGSFYFIGLGRITYQANIGYIVGDIPYGNLYNGRGSLRYASIVAHNSFETMRYNEFLSDKYFSLFLSYKLGKIRIKSKGDQPSFEILHNMGWGSLQKPNLHNSISFNTMEKGFFETGFFVNDLFTLRIYSLKAGLGMGAFYRYGPYANPRNYDNVVFKVATDFNF